MSEKQYSLDNELFYNREHIEDLIKCHHNEGDQITLYYGDKEPVTHSEFVVDGDDIINDMVNKAYECNEWADDYLGDLDQEDLDELSKIVLDFFNKKAEQPTFYRIVHIESKTITVGRPI